MPVVPPPSVPEQRIRRSSFASVEEVIDARAVVSLYQPLVDLVTGEVLGYEALARGPKGSAWERPDLLFDAARACGRLAELDWVCRAAAFRGALDARLAVGVSLFVNVEPEALGSPCPPDLLELVREAERSLRVVVEMTERALTRDPAALLAAVERARAVGWGVAMDDVGVEPASLALMPFVHPDVVKLDMRLVQQPADDEGSAICSAIQAQAERTGARILAEGIETERHRQRALALGATVGQGWLFGRPGALPRTSRPHDVVRLLRPVDLPHDLTPFSLVAGRADVRTAPKSLLLPLSQHLERRALVDGEPPVVLSTFQSHEHFTSRSAGRYARLTRRSALVAALGVGIGPRPVGEVRGADVAAGEPLAQEWDVVVVGPHYAAALLARDLGDAGTADGERRFSFLLTHDRDLVLQAARALLLRVVARESADGQPPGR